MNGKIGNLFHLNNIRIQYAPSSSMFHREDKRLRELVEQIKEIFQEQRKKKRIHHSQMSVLKSLSNHWEGLCIFVEHPEIPMDNNGSLFSGIYNPQDSLESTILYRNQGFAA